MDNNIMVTEFKGQATTLKFNYNFDELNNNLDIVEKLVAEIDPATADYNEVLDMEKKLKKVTKSIENTGKEAMAPAKAVIKEFEANLRLAKERVAKIQEPLTKKHEAIDAIRKQEKQAAAEKIIADAVNKAGLSPKFAAQVTVKPSYLNLSGTKKAVVEDVEKVVAELLERQEAETKLLVEANAVIDTVNENITQKLTITDFKSEYDYACRQTVLDSKMLLDAIRDRAKKIAEAEAEVARKAAEEAERKAKAEAEAEIAKRAKEEAEKLASQAKETRQEETAVEEAVKPAMADLPEVKTPVMPGKKLSFADIEDDEIEEIPDDEEIEKACVSKEGTDIWEMVVRFPGGTADYAELERFCKDNNVGFAVEIVQLKGSTQSLKLVGDKLKQLGKNTSYETLKDRCRKIS